MSKFGNLSGSADGTFRVRLIDRKTDRPIQNQAGEDAWIDVIFSNEFSRARIGCRSVARAMPHWENAILSSNLTS